MTWDRACSTCKHAFPGHGCTPLETLNALASLLRS